MDNSNSNILHRIEQIHAMSPDDAIVLDSNLEAALRKAIANAGGGDLVVMPTGNTAPSYTGRVLTLGERSNFFEVVNAPILGVWAGATLIAEREFKRCRVRAAHSKPSAATADEPKMLDRVVARAKATGGAASVTFEELLQLKNEIESAGGRLLVAGLPGKVVDGHTGRVLHQRGHRYIVPIGAGQGDIQVELDSEPAGAAPADEQAAGLQRTQQAVEAAAKATATAGAAIERAREAAKRQIDEATIRVKVDAPAMSDIAERLTAAVDLLKSGDAPSAVLNALAAASLAELGRLHFVEVGDANKAADWAASADRLRNLADAFLRAR